MTSPSPKQMAEDSMKRKQSSAELLAVVGEGFRDALDSLGQKLNYRIAGQLPSSGQGPLSLSFWRNTTKGGEMYDATTGLPYTINSGHAGQLATGERVFHIAVNRDGTLTYSDDTGQTVNDLDIEAAEEHAKARFSAEFGLG